jgi:mannose-6-phosphate isomerase class I
MNLRKFRWSKVYESQEEELVEFLRDRKIVATHWEVEAFDVSDTWQDDTETTLWCAEGSLTLVTKDAKTSLQPGDAIRIPADTSYTLQAGMTGYICYKS